MGCLEEDKDMLTRLFDAYNYTKLSGKDSEVLTCKGKISFQATHMADEIVVEIDETQKK
jgi:hypothetical protein